MFTTQKGATDTENTNKKYTPINSNNKYKLVTKQKFLTYYKGVMRISLSYSAFRDIFVPCNTDPANLLPIHLL